MADKITVRSNFHKIDIIHGWQLTDREKREFDYYRSLSDLHEGSFFRYKGRVYDMAGFSVFPETVRPKEFQNWEAYINCDYSSGLVIRYAPDTDFECIQVGYWFR